MPEFKPHHRQQFSQRGAQRGARAGPRWHLDGGLPLQLLATQAGISRRIAYKFHGWRNGAQAMGWKTQKARPPTPRTNGKAERFITTLLEEWADVMPYGTSSVRSDLLTAYRRIHVGGRCPMTHDP